MNVSELKESKFLKKEDCGQGILVTIAGVEQQNVAKEGAPPEMKWCLHLRELEKPMVLNATNGQIIASITGSDESDGWLDWKIVLYHDPNITFGGKLVGGIRVRAPRNKPGEPPYNPPQARVLPGANVPPDPLPDYDSQNDIPF